MSGGGYNGYVPSTKTSFDCETGIIITILSSVDVNVLPHHVVGNVLSVNLNNNSVVVENNNGEILGSILHANVNDLKECINQGNSYSAEITSVSTMSCSVKIFKEEK